MTSEIYNSKFVYAAFGELDAESIRILLESFNIKCILIGESVGKTYGLTVTPTGRVNIYVHKNKYVDAMKIIEMYQKGDLEKDLKV